jgi:hypothetical protein
MDYETFYAGYSEQTAGLKNQLGSLQKSYKRLTAAMERGDVRAGTKELDLLTEICAGLSDALASAQAAVSDFDYSQYMASGDFARQFSDCCAEEGLNLRQEDQYYEIFPYRLRLDIENSDVYINRRKLPSFRPGAIAASLKKDIAKLYAASFDPRRFGSEMAAAYDLCLLRRNSGKTTAATTGDVYLKDIYNYLAPMQRFRSEYDRQAYALDLARLFMAKDGVTNDNRHWQFGPGRNSAKAIRLVDSEGREHFLSTILFYPAEEQ